MYTNELIHETSPYLLQHAHNPVNWVAWSEKSLMRAQAENKLLIVSIGYSACHWCHVMERESFENEAVARVMNEHFISIKVDREERPDVDMIYMDAVQLITGHGGWPLNAICLPNGKPIYAGTYFRPEQWVQVLQFLENEFRNEPEKTAQRADEITEHIQAMNVVPLLSESVFSKDTLPTSWTKYKQTWDFEFGGRKGAPKFPMPSNLKYLLELYASDTERSRSDRDKEEILNALTTTLDGMILGGIFDQAGGGFARYSVDEFWHIPHFEKMLYDNAQLIEVYALAYQLTKKHEYKTVVYRTTEFLLRELRDESGIFYSALDADSEGEEGKFYVWTKRELEEILKDDFAEFEKRFAISEEGNFESANHLVRKTMDGFGSEQEFRWMNLLLHERSKRIRPNLDDKSLLSWNALLLAGFSTAYRVFDDELFLENARSLEKVLREKMIAKDGSLYRSYKKGKSTISAFLEDYSLFALAYIKLYEATFDETFLVQANALADYAVQHFYNPQNGMFFFSAVDADDQLISRKTETSDNVIPSSNAVMATVLHYLGEVFENVFYQKTALQMMKNIQPLAEQHPYFYSLWASLQLRYIFPPAQMAIVGDDFWTLKKEAEEFFLPNVFLLGTKNESEIPLLKDKHKVNETLIYVCRNGYCGLPVKTTEEAMKEL